MYQLPPYARRRVSTGLFPAVSPNFGYSGSEHCLRLCARRACVGAALTQVVVKYHKPIEAAEITSRDGLSRRLRQVCLVLE